MRRLTCVLALVTGLLAAGDAVRAQTTVLLRIVYSEPFGCPEGGCGPALFAFEPETRSVLRKEPVPGGSGSYVTPDGALMVWLDGGFGPAALILRSMASGATTAVPVSAFAAAMIGNPTRPEVYLNDEAGAVALSVAGGRPLSSPPCAAPRAAAISENGQRVVYTCFPGGGNPGYTAVLDAGTGALVRSLPFGWSPALSADGRSLYLVETLGNDGTRIRRDDLDAGVMLRDVLFDPGVVFPSMAIEPRTGRLFVSLDGLLRVLDGTTLDPINFPGALPGGVLAFDALRARAYVSSSRAFEPFTHYNTSFSVIDTDTLTLLDLFGFLSHGPALSLVLAPRPAAPMGLATVIQGSDVQLSWSAGVSNATTLRYAVEAGTASGLANITTFDVGLQTSLTVPGVPAGTYYVRVRAGNHTGLSAPSNEAIVVVP
jgi:hypothetical protein